MFWPFERWDTRSLFYGPDICIDMALWDRLPGTLDGTILSIAVQLYKNLAQGTRGSFRTWAADSPARLGIIFAFAATIVALPFFIFCVSVLIF